jgi:hypothetical protein
MTNACCCVVVTHNKVVVGLRHADVMKLFHSDDVSNRPARKMSRLASYPSCSKAISLRGRTAVFSCVIPDSCRPVVVLLSFGELSARLLGKLVRRVGGSQLVAAKVKRRQGPITRALPFPAQISHYMRPLASCTDGRHECECKAVARTREC